MELTELKAKALLAFPKAGKETKQVLCDLFGRDTFESFKYEDLDEIEQKVVAAYSRLRAAAKEKRGSWKPDFTNSSQYKYYPWFKYIDGVGFVVGVTGTFWAFTRTDVGSRLCFPTSEMAIEFAKENSEDYNTILSN